jgi:hypothetical protein
MTKLLEALIATPLFFVDFMQTAKPFSLTTWLMELGLPMIMVIVIVCVIYAFAVRCAIRLVANAFRSTG